MVSTVAQVAARESAADAYVWAPLASFFGYSWRRRRPDAASSGQGPRAGAALGPGLDSAAGSPGAGDTAFSAAGGTMSLEGALFACGLAVLVWALGCGLAGDDDDGGGGGGGGDGERGEGGGAGGSGGDGRGAAEGGKAGSNAPRPRPPLRLSHSMVLRWLRGPVLRGLRRWCWRCAAAAVLVLVSALVLYLALLSFQAFAQPVLESKVA